MLAMVIFCLLAAFRRKRAFCCGSFWRWPHSESTFSEIPEDILDKRYAIGDITKQEYEEKLRDIQRP